MSNFRFPFRFNSGDNGTHTTTTPQTTGTTYFNFPSSQFNTRTSINLTIEDINQAIINNDVETVINVLNKGLISINQTLDRDPYRNTLLHTAIEMKNEIIIKKLIDMGADLKLKNKKGESCADMLSYRNLGDIIQYIYDRDNKKVEILTKEVVEKNTKIKVLENNYSILQVSNNKTIKEKQEIEKEVIVLKKRKIELEEINTNLIKSSKKQKN
jgi:hypothetical protein